MLRSFRPRRHVPFRTRNGVIGVRHIIESGAADTQCQYRSRAKDQFSHHGSSPVFRKFANPLSHYSERPGCKLRSRGQRVKILGQATDLISMSRQSIEVAANVNYVPFIEQKPEICVNLVSNL
jgi:hypothetical protein